MIVAAPQSNVLWLLELISACVRILVAVARGVEVTPEKLARRYPEVRTIAMRLPPDLCQGVRELSHRWMVAHLWDAGTDLGVLRDDTLRPVQGPRCPPDHHFLSPRILCWSSMLKADLQAAADSIGFFHVGTSIQKGLVPSRRKPAQSAVAWR